MLGPLKAKSKDMKDMVVLWFQPQSREVLKKGIHMLVRQHYAHLHTTPTALARTVLKYI
jgi:hypothetical protein